MTIFRTLELVSGTVTGLLGVSYVFLQMPADAEFRGLEYFLGWFLVYGLPGLVTAAGAYFHSVKYKSGGLVAVGIMTLLSVIYILLAFFGGVIGYYGVWAFLSGVAPAIMSIVTGAFAFAVVAFEKSE
jgi:hypothetical protein